MFLKFSFNPDKFNQTLSNTYDQVAQSVAEMKENMKDQKDRKREGV